MAFLALVVGIWAIGDIVSVKTKSYLSVIFVGSAVYLLGYWTKLVPADVVDRAGLTVVANFSVYLLITHMGTLLNIDQLMKEWKAVSVAISGLIGLTAVMWTLGRIVIGPKMAIAATPPIAGGIVAALLMSEQATALGLSDLAVFSILVVTLQGFVGIPIASYCLNKESGIMLAKPDFLALHLAQKPAVPGAAEKEPKKRLGFRLPALSDQYQTSTILLAKVVFVAALALWIGRYTEKYYFSPYVLCLFLGVIAREIGFLEADVLEQANSFGFLVLALMANLPSMLAKATPAVVMKMMWPIIASLSIGALGLIIGSLIGGKVVGYSPKISIAIGLSAMYGFPSSYILAHEVSQAQGTTKEEREVLLDVILPKVLVGGFVTHPFASVILAGVMLRFL